MSRARSPTAGDRRAGDRANRLGYPEDSTLFYPVLLYQQGFRYFNMGYASAMAMVLLVVAFAVTAVIIRQLAALGALPGGDALMATSSASPRRRVAARPAPASRDRPATPGSDRRREHSLLIARP